MPEHTSDTIRKQESFFNSQMIKFLSACYVIGAPWFIWATIEIFSMKSQIALVEQKQDVIEIIQRDIREIKDSLVDMKIKVGKIEQKVEIK